MRMLDPVIDIAHAHAAAHHWLWRIEGASLHGQWAVVQNLKLPVGIVRRVDLAD